MDLKLSRRIIAFASRLETVEFAKWVRGSMGTLHGELGNGMRFRAERAQWGAGAEGFAKERILKVLKPVPGSPGFDKNLLSGRMPEGANMTISKGSDAGKAVDHRTAYVDLLDSPRPDPHRVAGTPLKPGEMGTMENARAHRDVSNTILTHLRKNNTALRYSATPLDESGVAGKLGEHAPGSKELLNKHYETGAKRHGFDPVPGEGGPGHSGSVLVPRPGMIRTAHLGPTGPWKPGSSKESGRVAARIEDHQNPEAAIIRRKQAARTRLAGAQI